MENVHPVFAASITPYLGIGLIALFVLIGIRYTYRAFMFRFVFYKPFTDQRIQAAVDTLPPHRSAAKALAAFAIAFALAWIYYLGIRP